MRAPLFGALLLTLTPLAARADGDFELEGLLNETIITTASKSAETGSLAPATSTTISAEDLRRYGIKSLAEAIDFLALGVSTSTSPSGAELGSRGVLLPRDHNAHFALLLNGHVMNDSLRGGASVDRGAGIPMELIDHIEVILGPGSVLYGSNAMLGVINVVTKRARDFAGVHAIAETEVGRWYRASLATGQTFTLFGTKHELTLQAEYAELVPRSSEISPQNYYHDRATTNDLWRFSRDGAPTGIWGGTAGRADYQKSPAAHLQYRMGEWELNLHASVDKRGRLYNQDKVTPEADFDDPANYDVNRSLWFDLKRRFDLSSLAQLSTRLYGDGRDARLLSVASSVSGCLYEGVRSCRYADVSRNRWMGAEVQTTFDWLTDSRLITLLGVDGRISTVQSKLDVEDFDRGRPLRSSASVVDERDATLGAYLEQKFQVSPAFGANAGSRLDLDRRFGHVFSPRLSANLSPWKGGTLKAIYSEAFRAPSWYEWLAQSDSQIAAKGLQPERVRSFELSMDQKLGAHRLVYGMFLSHWSDLVELSTLTIAELNAEQMAGRVPINSHAVTQYRNIASIDDVGYNAGYDGAFARLRLGLNATGSVAHRSEGETQMPPAVAPRLLGNARLAYELPGQWPTLALAVHYLARRPADRAYDSGFLRTPFAPPKWETQLTASGKVPGVEHLLYRMTAHYALPSQEPYVIGPIQGTTEDAQTLQTQGYHLLPVEAFRGAVSLQYDF